MKTQTALATAGINRRGLLKGAGVTALAATAGVGLSSKPANADEVDQLKRARPIPKPIPGGIDAPPEGFIHWFLPGPTDAVTPVLGLQGFGLDVEPSTITDFKGVTAYAVVAGRVVASDGNTYPCEFDVRVMQGRYIAEDGVDRFAAFAFL